MKSAPPYHGISGLPPFELFDDYMDPIAREKYGLKAPSEWTTLTGLVVDQDSGLCLGGRSPSEGTNLNYALGSQIELKPCSADGDVQWMYGSDLGMYDYEKQVREEVELVRKTSFFF